jgi:hypothetical protein
MGILVEGVVNLIYTLEASSDLHDWHQVETVTMPASSRWEFSDPEASSMTQRRFYRLGWNAP